MGLGLGPGHAPRESAGSFEPLIAAAGLATPPLPPTPIASSSNTAGPPPAPSRSLAGAAPSGEDDADADDTATHKPIRDSASSVYSVDDQLVDLSGPLEVRHPNCRFELER